MSSPACPRAASSSDVLPIPGSPTSTSAPEPPERAASTTDRMRASSSSRPCSMEPASLPARGLHLGPALAPAAALRDPRVDAPRRRLVVRPRDDAQAPPGPQSAHVQRAERLAARRGHARRAAGRLVGLLDVLLVDLAVDLLTLLVEDLDLVDLVVLVLIAPGQRDVGGVDAPLELGLGDL